MPTFLILEGYRFFFYSRENGEPPHIHSVLGLLAGYGDLTRAALPPNS